MNSRVCLLLGIAAVVASPHTFPASGAEAARVHTRAKLVAIQGRNSISGFIFDTSRRPVSDVYVELLSDAYSNMGRVRTDGSGRYSFSYIPQGNYKVRAMPRGTDWMEQTQDVSIVNISIVAGGGAENVQLDFYLKARERSNAGPFAGAPGIVFAQQVPDTAKKLYEEGINNLKDNKEQPGFDKLKNALEIFPNYYLALDRLGTEYVTRGYYEPACILLTKAVEINSRGYSSVYALGLAQYHLNLTDQSVENFRRATTLYGNSFSAHLWLGLALKRTGKIDQAETAFQRAKELSKDKEPEVHWQMARLYSEQKRYKEAVTALELLLKNNSDKFDADKIKRLIQQLREKTAAK